MEFRKSCVNHAGGIIALGMPGVCGPFPATSYREQHLHWGDPFGGDSAGISGQPEVVGVV